MDHKYVDELDLIDQYLMDRLTPEESESLEDHFVDCAKCIDRLKTTQNFLQDLQSVTVGQLLQTGDYAPRTLRGLLLQAYSSKSFGKTWALAFTCLLLIGIVGTILVVRQIKHSNLEVTEAKSASARLTDLYEEERQSGLLSDEKHQETEQELTEQIRELEARLKSERKPGTSTSTETDEWMQPRVNLSIFVLNSVRGDETPESVNEVSLPQTPVGFVLSLPLPGEVEHRDYRATLSDGDRTLWKKSGLKLNRYNALSIGFNSRFFQSGRYLLIVEGTNKGGSSTFISNYPFRIIKDSLK